MDSFPLIVLITAVVVASAFSVVSVLMLVRSWRRLGRRHVPAEPAALPTAGFGPPPARRKRSRWTFAAYGVAVMLAAPAAYYAVVVLGAHTDRPRADRERGFALPFIGLQSPRGVAIDAKGNVYVADNTDSRVFELTAGSNTQTVVPFTGLHEPTAVAVDAAGNVYVSDVVDSRVLKLAAGSSTQIELDRPGVEPEEVAVDTAGTVYVSVNEINGLHDDSHLLSLAAGSHSWTRLPSAGVEEHVAADAAGDVYVTTSGDSEDVMRLAPGSAHWTPFPGLYLLKGPRGWAVDARGNVYVTGILGKGSVVLKLPAG